jgi:hypothetical protein
MRKILVFSLSLITFLLPLFSIVLAGSSDTWKSCCSSGCNYSPGQTVYIGGRTYYCCSNGWQTSPCPTTTTTSTSTTTTTTIRTTTTTTTSTSTTTTTTTTTLPGFTTSCNGRSTSSDVASISPTQSWQTISSSLSSSTDTKRYRVNIQSTGQYEFSLCPADGGTADFDTYLCLFDSNGNLLASNDDDCEPRSRQSKIIYNFDSTGTYYIQVSGFGSYYGSYTLAYRKAPVTIIITSCNASFPPERSTSSDVASISPTQSWQTISGSLSSIFDTKRYRVNIQSTGQYEFSLCPEDGGSADFDTYLCLFDSNGNLLTSNDDFCGQRSRQSKIIYNFGSTGTYYIQVSGYNGYYGSYTLAYRKAPVTTTTSTTTTSTTTTTTSTTTSTTSTTSTTTSTTTSSTTTTSTSTTTTTTTLPPCYCSQCGFYSSSNCNYACNEWQNCVQSTCSASGCISNSNCYKCEWKSCSNVQPKVYILTPFIVSGGNLTVSVYFECSQWSSSAKNLTLSLKIDNKDWNECFLNNKGLMTDFGWNSNCNNMMSGNCGSNNQWKCDSQAYCKNQNYDLWTKSNFNNRYVNVTFTCKLPYLSGGSHTLTVIAKVYGSETTLKPSIITFRVVETDGRKILEFLLFPLKALRGLLPF